MSNFHLASRTEYYIQSPGFCFVSFVCLVVSSNYREKISDSTLLLRMSGSSFCAPWHDSCEPWLTAKQTQLILRLTALHTAQHVAYLHRDKGTSDYGVFRARTDRYIQPARQAAYGIARMQRRQDLRSLPRLARCGPARNWQANACRQTSLCRRRELRPCGPANAAGLSY